MKLKIKNWHKLFNLSVWIKLLNGLFESLSGLLILLLPKNVFINALLYLTRGELLEDPNDKIINYISHSLQTFSNNTKTFVALYILIHGLLNLFLAMQLFRKQLWAYLVSIIFVSLFIIYQIYRISYLHSFILIPITVFEILFVILTWHEYKNKLEA